MTTLTLERPGTWTETEAREEGRRANEARRFLLPFCQWVNPRFEIHPHLELAARELEAIARGDNDFLMILMPPRHGKSELASRRFPAYYMGRDPTRRVILASYGAALAHRLGRTVRNTMKMDRYREIFPDTRLAGDSTAAHQFDTTADGGLIAVGVDGAVTGSGGDLTIIDDPVKNREEAESVTMRERAWEWYTTDLYTRREPGAATVLIMTPWHTDDLHGRILDHEGEQHEGGKWRVVRLPALAEADDPLDRKVGEALWPGRFDLKALADIRKVMGERQFAALYQQRPSPAEGAIFKKFPRYSLEDKPKYEYILLPIDSAITGENDPWAWSAWGVRSAHLDLLDAWQMQTDPATAEASIFKTWVTLTRLRYPDVRVVPIVRESVAIDRLAAEHLKALGIPVQTVKLPSMGGKDVKRGLANLIVDYFDSQLARIPESEPEYSRNEGRPFLGHWLEVHKAFDSSDDDHLVENTILALHAHRLFAQGANVKRDANRSRYAQR